MKMKTMRKKTMRKKKKKTMTKKKKKMKTKMMTMAKKKKEEKRRKQHKERRRRWQFQNDVLVNDALAPPQNCRTSPHPRKKPIPSPLPATARVPKNNSELILLFISYFVRDIFVHCDIFPKFGNFELPFLSRSKIECPNSSEFRNVEISQFLNHLEPFPSW